MFRRRLGSIKSNSNTQWQTAIWFDTKQDTYLLPLKAAVRKKECIELNKPLQVIVCV